MSVGAGEVRAPLAKTKSTMLPTIGGGEATRVKVAGMMLVVTWVTTVPPAAAQVTVTGLAGVKVIWLVGGAAGPIVIPSVVLPANAGMPQDKTNNPIRPSTIYFTLCGSCQFYLES
jgi:hypothetical protein